MYVRAAHVNVTDVSIRDRHGAISEGPLLLSERARDHDAVGRSGGSQQETESHGQGGPTHSAGTCIYIHKCTTTNYYTYVHYTSQ